MLHVEAFDDGFVAMGTEASHTRDETFGTRVVAWTSLDGLTWVD